MKNFTLSICFLMILFSCKTEYKPRDIESIKIEKIKPKPSEKVAEAETLGAGFKSAAWVVQVASFSNESNAINLVEKLKKHHLVLK